MAAAITDAHSCAPTVPGAPACARAWPRAWSGLLALLAGLLLPLQLSALDPQRSLTQLYHSAWTIKEGAPGQITALAQTADGYLWLGTQTGLFRFDGVSFERYAPAHGGAFPGSSVAALYAPSSGGLWVGFRYGVASFVEGNVATHFGEAQGLPTGSVYGFASGEDGTLWAATYQGLARLEGARWALLNSTWDYAGRQARSVFADRDGQLWAASEDALLVLPRGGRRFRTVATGLGRISRIAQDAAGVIWIGESNGSVRAIAAEGKALAGSAALAHAAGGLLFDRDGSLWITSLGEGVYRIADPAAWRQSPVSAVQEFRQRQGLSADYVGPVIEDREGNVWIGSSHGLDRFRHSHLLPAEFPDGSFDFALVAGEAGAIYAGTRNRPLMRMHGQQLSFNALQASITAAWRDRDQSIWLAGSEGIWRLRGDRAEHLTALPAAITYSGVQALVRDQAGALWVSLNTPGIYRWQDGNWTHLHDHPALSEGSSPLCLLSDTRGRVWMGFARNELTRMQGNDLRLYTAADGLQIGNITALLQQDDTLWVGGERGLAYYVEGADRFRMVAASADDTFTGISGMVTSGGDLWLNAATGVIRVDAGQIERLRVDEKARADFTRFDFLDGLPGTPAQFRPLPTAIAGSDGRLWFASTSGVVSIDPRQIEHNPLPPPVAIRALRVNGAALPLAASLQLPALTQNLEIDYTALSLSIPERVRYRYQLQGFDPDWQEVGTRRTAYYSHLAPGSYRFTVIASNNDGVWNEVGATVGLEIAPAFFQTRWFAALCVLAVFGVLWLLYLLRLRRLGLHIRTRLHERHLERERIARELHDTLLQSIQGLILRFQAVAETIPAANPARQAIESALDRADQVLAEGRDRVIDLRASSAYEGELPETFAKVAEELAQEHPANFSLVVHGVPQPIDPIVRDEIFRVGREALVNAYRHANAATVEVEITHSRDELRLRFIDDGRGIEPGVLKAGGRPGHWGLSGMRERAARIEATLNLWSRPGAGTEVELRMDASAAYRPCLKKSRWRWMRRMLGDRS